MDMSFEQLNFVVYCIGSVADALKMNARKGTSVVENFWYSK